MKKILAGITAFLFSFNLVLAAVDEPEPPAPAPARCDLTFASGKTGKGYSNIVRNIKDVCPNLPVCDKESEGGLENLTLLSTKVADIALVQADTLMQMQGSDDALKQMQVVASLHSNLLHVLTKANGFDFKTKEETKKWYGGKDVIEGTSHVDVNKFSDLKGKTVGLVGSAALLVRKLNDASGHGMQFIDFAKDDEAVKALMAQKVYAVLTMAAWPHGYVKELTPGSGVKLIAYDLAPTAPYSVVKKNYQKLGQFGVAFLSAPNLLVTRPFTQGGENAKNVAAVKNCIVTNLGKLKDGKFEPGWGEVTNIEETFGLPKFVGTTSKAPAKKK
jgi:TRAP-type uncharacterized transport system substrate-binding protein